jgi:hypothetical protein
MAPAGSEAWAETNYRYSELSMMRGQGGCSSNKDSKGSKSGEGATSVGEMLDEVEGAYYLLVDKLPADLRNFSPTSLLDGRGFLKYITAVAWITCVALGLQLEVVFGGYFASMLKKELDAGQSMKASQSAKDTYVTWWHIAQLMFPLMLLVAIMSRSVFGLPFMVFGLYKFGFPEIVSYLAEAKAKHTQFCYDKNKSQEGPVPLTVRQVMVWHLHLLHPRVLGPFMDGLGLHLHHMAASYVICSMATHLFPLKRQLVAPCIVCVIQHWFVLLKYHSSTCYILVELGLELWFEWEVLGNLEYYTEKEGLARWGVWWRLRCLSRTGCSSWRVRCR